MGFNDGKCDYVNGMAQCEQEIARLVEIAHEAGCRSYLEIGSRFGGSLWYIGTRLSTGSRLVSIDNGMGMGGYKLGQTQSLGKCCDHLRRLGYDAYWIRENSQVQKAIRAAGALGPYDLVFIDGDHSYEGVTADWLNYSPMGRLIALHDVTWMRKPHMSVGTKEVECKKLWKKITSNGVRHELIDHHWNMGIGVIWRQERD